MHHLERAVGLPCHIEGLLEVTLLEHLLQIRDATFGPLELLLIIGWQGRLADRTGPPVELRGLLELAPDERIDRVLHESACILTLLPGEPIRLVCDFLLLRLEVANLVEHLVYL